MKMFVQVPVEKIKGKGYYTLRCELLEVEVVKLFRIPANRYNSAFYYQVEHKPLNNQLDISGDNYETKNKRVNIIRKKNKQFKPKDFIFVNNQVEI